jgi:Do/DeqQ family serine protease
MAWVKSIISTLIIFLSLFSSMSMAKLPIAVDGEPLPSLAPMLEKANPAVVNIATSAVFESQLLRDPFFGRTYRTPERRQTNSLGSGVIVDATEGIIITNAHVIAGADDIEVTLQDGRHFSAQLLGSDKQTDVAIIKIKANNLTALPLADSDELRVGDFVVAIGNPYSLGHTVTSGIVSALGRQGLGIEEFEDFIQTDAAINPGNSGGALVNLRGELIGINTAIFAPSGGNVGIGFAIPINLARSVMVQLINYGEVRRGLLGITSDNLTPDLARAFNSQLRHGVVVTDVITGSPADKAGIKRYDIIYQIDKRAIRNKNELNNYLGLQLAGTRVKIQLERANKPLTLETELAEMKVRRVKGDELHPLLEGVSFKERYDDDRQFIGIEVTDIKTSSRAAQLGLRSGDIIIGVGRYRARSMQEFESLIGEYGRTIRLTFYRSGRELSLYLR